MAPAPSSNAKGSGPTPLPSRLRWRRAPYPAILLLVGALACRAGAPRPAVQAAAPAPASNASAFLDDLEHRTFRWFWELSDPQTGLIPDRAPTPSFSSVAAVGFGLTADVIGVQRGWVARSDAAARAARTLRFLRDAPQTSAGSDATGYRGFFYHFLDMRTGKRFEKTELSTIDSALLFAGALTCASYFDRPDETERQIREDADAIYRRAEWDWASPRPPGIAMGWTPEAGFHDWNWHGYDESMILYVLALGSPTHPADPHAWNEFVSTYRWGTYFGQSYVQFSPLFGHQYSHLWIDFRGIADRYMREKGIDYFENSRRATLAHRAYATFNPMGWKGYGSSVWGLTACDGPLDATLSIGGRKRTFHSYWPRGASLVYVNDDGTIAPTAAAGSIPFAPEVAIPAARDMVERWGPYVWNEYGFVDAFNPTLDDPSIALKHGRIVPGVGWFDSDQLGIDQGPIVAMIENYRSEFVWRILRRNPYVTEGLRRAGFSGGWLDASPR